MPNGLRGGSPRAEGLYIEYNLLQQVSARTITKIEWYAHSDNAAAIKRKKPKTKQYTLHLLGYVELKVWLHSKESSHSCGMVNEVDYNIRIKKSLTSSESEGCRSLSADGKG